MFDMVKEILSLMPFGAVIYIAYILSKVYATYKICKHTDLSEEKVKCITNMMRYDGNKLNKVS